MIELLRTRRSIRKYQPRALEPAARAVLEEAVLRAPSSRGRKPWEFVFVDDPRLLAELARTKSHGSSFLAGGALGIVICADEQICDVWVEDCSIAAFIAHVVAHSLGLGSCWIQVRRRPHDERQSAEQFVKQLLGIPARLRVGAIVAVGYPDEEKAPRPTDQLNRDKIHRNRFG